MLVDVRSYSSVFVNYCSIYHFRTFVSNSLFPVSYLVRWRNEKRRSKVVGKCMLRWEYMAEVKTSSSKLPNLLLIFGNNPSYLNIPKWVFRGCSRNWWKKGINFFDKYEFCSVHKMRQMSLILFFIHSKWVFRIW